MGWTQVRRALGIMLTGCALAAGGCKTSSGDADKDKSSKDDKDDDKDKDKGKKKKGKDEDDEDGGKDKPTKAGASSQPKTGNKGSFTYLVKPAADPDDKIIEPLFTENKRIEAVIKAMGVFALPQDLPVLATDEGPCEKQLNAFYSSKAHGIFICYPLVKAFYSAFLKAGVPDADAADHALNAIGFVLMHEMGHALVGELGLGVTGKEEDAVDELAALILIQNGKPDWAVKGTQAMMEVFKTGDKPPFYDEHSVSEARFYDILCMIYGSEPSKYGGIVENVPELKARALSGKCEKFYKSTDKAWTDMLAPHTRG